MDSLLAHIAPAAAGFVGGVIAWFLTNFWGRPLVRFWDLRQKAHEAIFYYSNLSVANDVARVKQGSARLRRLAARMSALQIAVPKFLAWLLRLRGYDLRGASIWLAALSATLGRQDAWEIEHRVKSQRALRLPVDRGDRERFERQERLERTEI